MNNVNILSLPDDVSELKKLLLQKIEQVNAFESRINVIESERNVIRSENSKLQELVAFLRHQIFVRKSDKWTKEDKEQGLLFDEIERVSDKEKVSDKIEVAGYVKSKAGKKGINVKIPRNTITHDLDEDKKICHCGEALTNIGLDVSEKLEVIPAQFTVTRHEYLKYVCKNCEGWSYPKKVDMKKRGKSISIWVKLKA